MKTRSGFIVLLFLLGCSSLKKKADVPPVEENNSQSCAFMKTLIKTNNLEDMVKPPIRSNNEELKLKDGAIALIKQDSGFVEITIKAGKFSTELSSKKSRRIFLKLSTDVALYELQCNL